MRDVQISDHFDSSTILIFALPSIGMMLVANVYLVATGFLVSNYIGAAAFAAENLIIPPFQILAGLGMMFGTGASAVIARELGAGRPERACGILSMIFLALALIGLLIAALLYPKLPAIATWVGASENLVPICVEFGGSLMLFIPFQMLTMLLQILLITAGRPGLGFAISALQAAVNILMVWVFVVVCGWGMKGAALGIGLAWLSGLMIPLVYFSNPKNQLHFVRPICAWKIFGKTMYNGASQLVDITSVAIVSVVFNLQLMRYLGEFGVAAYAVGGYVMALLFSTYGGVSMSIVPVVGYHFGAGNHEELRSLRRKGMLLVMGMGVLLAAFSAGLAENIAGVFVGYDESLKALTTEALHFLSLAFLFIGVIIFSSSYFTGLGQGTLSLIISLCNSLLGPLAMVHLLPTLLGRKGLWLAQPAAQCLTLLIVVTGCFLWWKRKSNIHIIEENR